MSSVSESTGGHIRRARPADVPTILEMIRALAVYEALEHELALDGDGLHTALFGEEAFAGALLAETRRSDTTPGQPVGYALYFKSFSTFLCRPGLYLEDLFVLPETRGRGLGLALLRAVCAEARTRGFARVEWSVLDWNTPAIAFYRRLGAVLQPEWQRFRLDGAALKAASAEIDAPGD